MKNRILLLMLALYAIFPSFSQVRTKPKIAATQSKPSAPKTTVAMQAPAQKEPEDLPVVTVPGKDNVAVYYFTTARDYSYDYAIGVGNAVEAGFLKSERFVVVERNRFGTIKEEDKFKEANTSEIVQKASRLGAKIIVTGHITGISKGNYVDSYGKPTNTEYAEISLSFKLIDVASGQIKMSENISGKGEGGTSAAAIQHAYIVIGALARSYVASYLPQRFKFMSVFEKKEKKKQEYLTKFKIWGGADNGLKIGDVIELYTITFITNPDTKKQVEEKKLLAQARIVEVNSGSTATCDLISPPKDGSLLSMAVDAPESMIIEYKGNWYVKPKSIWDRL